MTSREFEEWKLIYTIFEPFGEYRMDLRAGFVAAPIMNLLLGLLAKDPKFRKPTEWLMKFDRRQEPLTVQDWRIGKMLCQALAEAGRIEEEQEKARQQPQREMIKVDVQPGYRLAPRKKKGRIITIQRKI